jgi:hypothetical protein
MKEAESRVKKQLKKKSKGGSGGDETVCVYINSNHFKLQSKY